MKPTSLLTARHAERLLETERKKDLIRGLRLLPAAIEAGLFTSPLNAGDQEDRAVFERAAAALLDAGGRNGAEILLALMRRRPDLRGLDLTEMDGAA